MTSMLEMIMENAKMISRLTIRKSFTTTINAYNNDKFKEMNAKEMGNEGGKISFSHLDLETTPNRGEKRSRLPNSQLVFGHSFTDHMLSIEWNKEKGWKTPKILPHGNLSIPPAAPALHYAVQVRII